MCKHKKQHRHIPKLSSLRTSLRSTKWKSPLHGDDIVIEKYAKESIAKAYVALLPDYVVSANGRYPTRRICMHCNLVIIDYRSGRT